MNPNQPKLRIGFIDLAKGFCIIFVVFVHILDNLDLTFSLSEKLSIFRMPLYFFLSGLFFKSYENMFGFIKRKINKLLIPFLFFFYTTSVLLPLFLNILGYEVRNDSFYDISILWAFIIPPHKVFSNYPIWFLLCLFVDNLYFYCIYVLSMKIWDKVNVVFIAAMSIIVGIAGFEMSRYDLELPLYLDTAMTALPFFACGYIINRHTPILQPNKSDKYIPLFLILSIILIALFSGSVSYAQNQYGTSIFALYICGLAGTLGIIFISKVLKHLPLVSYWGRYSIIILCTHNIILQFLIMVLKRCEFGDWPIAVLSLIITMLLYLALVPFFIRFFPYVVAQKDVIKID